MRFPVGDAADDTGGVMNMRIAIVGAGALGLYYGAVLQRAGEDVAFLLRRDYEAIMATGLTVRSINGDFHLASVRGARRPEEIGPVDLVIVGLKTFANDSFSPCIAPLLHGEPAILTLQNGLGNIEILAAQVGADRAMQGVTMQGATLLGPGRIRTSGRGATHLGYVPIELAAPRDFNVEHRAYEISALFNSAGLKSQVTADIDGLVWGKVIINAAINPLTAILRVPNGPLIESEETIGLMQAAALEAASVAAAKRITLPFPDPVERVKQVAAMTATNHSSMLQDVLGQRPTEIDAINGKIVEQGQALGIATPVNALLTSLMHAIQQNYTAESAEIAEKELQRQLRIQRP